MHGRRYATGARSISALVPGFATATRLDGWDRIVTFFNGAVARERLIDLDDDVRRLAWSIVEGPYTHHNASAQVLAAGDADAPPSGSPTCCPMRLQGEPPT